MSFQCAGARAPKKSGDQFIYRSVQL